MYIDKILTSSLLLLMLAGCGSIQPTVSSPLTTKTSQSQVEAKWLFSSFKEADYVETSYEELRRLLEEPSASDHGKKVKASGMTVVRLPEFGIGEVTVELYNEKQDFKRATIYTGGSIFSAAKKIGNQLYAGTMEQVTVYMTVNTKKGFNIDAVKNPDGKIEKL